VVTVTPNASGYLAGPDGAAYFNVTRTDDGCRAEEMQLSQVAGNVYAQLGDAQSNGLNASAISTLQVGMSVSQGMQVFTHDSSRATFALPLGGDNQAAVAINGRTTIEIGAYCRDSSGKLHIVLRASKPGQVLVKWPPNANADIKITTPAGDVSSVHTRYFISVDVDGATSLIGLEGTARFTDSQGGSVDVDAGKRVTVTEGQRVSGMIPVAVQGQVDPRLVAMLEPAGTAASFGASNTSSSTGSGSFDLATYSPWLIAAGAGILLLAVVYGFALTRSRSRKQVPMSAPPAMPPMPIMPVVDPFASVAAQYQWMRGEMAAGRMSLQQCNAMLAGMTVRDVYGRTWMLNGNDGHWLVYDGRQWIYANPYQPG
jgi:hypothetical protein